MKIGLFVDVSNLYALTHKMHGGGINYHDYKCFVEEALNGEVTRAIAYGYHDLKGSMHKFIESIKQYGYETKFVEGTIRTPYVRWDVEMIIDIMQYMDHFDCIVIGSNCKYLAPLVKVIRDKGKKCVIYACQVGRELRTIASAVYEVDKNDLITE